MIEIPEATNLAKQINNSLKGKKISNVQAGFTPHKFAWFNLDKEKYGEMLSGKVIEGAEAGGGMLELKMDKLRLTFCEGIKLIFHENGEKIPKKHQFFIEFDDLSFLTGSIQMYGGFYCFFEDEFANEYYLKAKNKPSIFSDRFDEKYFKSLLSNVSEKMSIKAFLATEQRIPGLGNGVLQDILYNAKLNPKKKIHDISDQKITNLFIIIKKTLAEMASMGGRDTEYDLFGCLGGYKTKCSKNTVGSICGECGSGNITKGSYMGGSIYFCENCQQL